MVDIRNEGLVAGIELAPRVAKTTRAYEVFERAFHEGVLLRYTGDIIAVSPPLIIEKNEIDRIFETIGRILKLVD